MDERGVPLSIAVTGANRHDVIQLAAVLGRKIAEPNIGKAEEKEEHLCADAGYVGGEPRKKMIVVGYTSLVRSRGNEKVENVMNPSVKAQCRVVEACHSWFIDSGS